MRQEMRPIVWGLVLFLAGILSAIILDLADFFLAVSSGPEYIATIMIPPKPTLSAILSNHCLYLGYFSLPLAIAIEAYRYIKGRKGEPKGMSEVIDDKVDKFHEALMKRYSKKTLIAAIIFVVLFKIGGTILIAKSLV